jgi:hypothetical protein
MEPRIKSTRVLSGDYGAAGTKIRSEAYIDQDQLAVARPFRAPCKP